MDSVCIFSVHCHQSKIGTDGNTICRTFFANYSHFGSHCVYCNLLYKAFGGVYRSHAVNQNTVTGEIVILQAKQKICFIVIIFCARYPEG